MAFRGFCSKFAESLKKRQKEKNERPLQDRLAGSTMDIYFDDCQRIDSTGAIWRVGGDVQTSRVKQCMGCSGHRRIAAAIHAEVIFQTPVEDSQESEMVGGVA